MSRELRIDVWSDIACPWCYIGKRRLETALAHFANRDSVDLVWHAFELDPAAPAVRDTTQQSYAERLAKKYGTSVARAEAMIQRVADTAAEEGLRFDSSRKQPGNTFNAHRLLHLAHLRGLQGLLKERLLAAYHSEGAAIGDSATLQRLAVEVGLDADEVDSVLSSDLYAREVRDDEAEAGAIGVDGVPFFVIGRRYAVAGAQPAELLLQALNKAWDELPPQTLVADRR